MTAMMIGLLWLGIALMIGELAARFLPDTAWEKLLRFFHFDE